MQTDHEFVQGDVRDAGHLKRAVEGVDAVVHGAALHGVHVETWPAEDFWSINATGTFHLLEAMREAGIEKLVLSSTMAVYGESMVAPAGAWGIVTERSPVLPRDVYGMSKWLCEDMARYYARRWGIATVSLRLGMFVPETFERYGFRLLFGGVDDRDVAQAVLLALAHRPETGFDAVNVFADVPFGPQDAEQLHTDPEQVLERYWPGCRELFEGRGLDVGEHRVPGRAARGRPRALPVRGDPLVGCRAAEVGGPVSPSCGSVPRAWSGTSRGRPSRGALAAGSRRRRAPRRPRR
jgi:hypothetical protein